MLDGVLELGLEIVIDGGVVREVRPHTGVPEMYVVSPAFVNAHSHLEYRGLLDAISAPEYGDWIREITRLKKEQDIGQVERDCFLAAKENVDTGVQIILEHSDRPFSGAAMRANNLQGAIFQEVITFLEHESPKEKVAAVEQRAATNRAAFGGPVYLSAHAYQTVDELTQRYLASLATPLSIHVAETDAENVFTRDGLGPIAEFYRENHVPFEKTGKSLLQTLDDRGLVRKDTQLVHCCAMDDEDIGIVAKRNACVAHCPRSNKRLRCPDAPIRRMLDAGIKISLGLDSAASSGPIDMFAEMRAALATSADRGEPLTPEEVWTMATTAGFESVRTILNSEKIWRIEPGCSAPLLKLHVSGATSTEDLLAGNPSQVEQINLQSSV